MSWGSGTALLGEIMRELDEKADRGGVPLEDIAEILVNAFERWDAGDLESINHPTIQAIMDRRYPPEQQ